MRIAQVMAGAPIGGAEAFFERATIALHNAGDIVLPIIRRDAGRAERLRAAGLQPVELAFGGALDFMTRPLVRRALQDFKPDVVMAWMQRAARFTPQGPWVLVGRFGGYYDVKYFRHCDHLVANTHDLVRMITAAPWPPARVHYLPNFVEDFAGSRPAELPAASSAPRLLAMGRLHPNKGFDVLLRAIALLPRGHLYLAGAGPEEAALRALAAELGITERVSFLGWRRDIGALLAAADIFICSSRQEPLGNIVLEAWSATKPVIASAAQGPSELISDGKDGVLAPREDAAALAAAIAQLSENPERAAALAAAGRAHFAAAFAEAPVIAHWRRLLADLKPARRA
ncbi:MAG: glycosyltransferase [Roseomonas sp.]|nr:glycosyltransferase [Roseomonas sp.]MCA3327194.1 glycosyltransferase [Roseomonas sp.]MCA3330089.1 glycosyltransferase [Roseomonas sp.]MCA3333751.1 glycosyltransferase [Roseomonas sp.]MCA3347954.1 glycosyltransferase [Roseomonas sp.]